MLIGGLAWGSVNATRTARNWSLHTYEVLGVIQDLALTMEDAETGQRGFLLTGNDAYLAPYTGARGRAGVLEGALHRLIADNPAEANRLLALTPLLARKFDELEQAIRARRSDWLRRGWRVGCPLPPKVGIARSGVRRCSGR